MKNSLRKTLEKPLSESPQIFYENENEMIKENE